MRISVILSVVALLTFSSYKTRAQYNFPVVEMEKLTAKNASDFETAVMEKDYSVDNKASTQVLKVYTSDKPSASGKANIITRYQVPNAVCKIELSTTDKKYYLEVKSKLTAMGFKLINNETKTIKGAQAQVYNYSNGPFQLCLSTYTTDMNWYVVEVNQ